MHMPRSRLHLKFCSTAAEKRARRGNLKAFIYLSN